MVVSNLSSQQTELLFEVSTGYLCITEADGYLRKVNSRFVQNFGYTENELLNSTLFNLTHPEDREISKLAFQQIMNGEIPPYFETRLICKDGSHRWLVWTYTYLKNGNIIYASAADITKQKEAENQLKKALEENEKNSARWTATEQVIVEVAREATERTNLVEEEKQHIYHRLNNVIENYTDGFFTLNKNWEVTSFNTVGQKMSKLSTKQLMNKNFFKIFKQAKKLKTYIEFTRDLNEITKPFEEYYPHLNSWLEVTAYPYENSLTVIIKDISNLKIQQMNIKLRNEVLGMSFSTNSKLKHVIDHLLQGIENIYPNMVCSVLTLDSKGTQLNYLSAPSLPADFITVFDASTLGADAAEWAKSVSLSSGKQVILNDISIDPYWKVYKDLALSFGLFAYWSFPIVNSKDQIQAIFEVCCRSQKEPTLDEKKAIEGIIKVLRILIENDLDKQTSLLSNERYRLATAATNDAIWDWDLINSELYWGEGFKTIFGYNIENQLVDISTWTDHIHPDDLKRVLENIDSCLADPTQQQWTGEYRYIRKNGSFADVLDKGYIIRNNDGIAIRMVGAMQDITERKKDLQKIQRSDDNYKILFSNNPVPMWAYVEQYNFTMVNDAALKLLGYSREEFLSLSLFDLRPPDEHERLAKILNEQNHFEEIKLYGEWRFLKKDGTIILIELVSHLIEQNGKKLRLIAVNDITESKKAKEAIVEQNKRLMEISQINSHEMRKPVASILGIVSLFDTENLSNEYNKELIDLLKVTTEELDQIIHIINIKASQISEVSK